MTHRTGCFTRLLHQHSTGTEIFKRNKIEKKKRRNTTSCSFIPVVASAELGVPAGEPVEGVSTALAEIVAVRTGRAPQNRQHHGRGDAKK